MNAVPRDVSSSMLKQSCPVKPKLRAVLNYTLIVGQFERDDSVVSQLWPQRNPFPRRSFVFSPVCPGEDYMVGPHCNLLFERAKHPQPPMLRVDTQPALHVPNAEKTVILRDYVYLEVDPRNGDLNYNATYNLYNYARPPKDFESDEIVCFLGDSHARFTWYQAKVIVQDRAINKTGCDDWSYHSSQDYNLTGQFRFMLMKFADDFLSSESKLKAGMFEECSMVVILYGHWDGGYHRKSPTTPFSFASTTRAVIERVQAVTKNDTRVFVASSDPFPLSHRIVTCVDWALPTLLDVYNAYLRNMTVEGDRPGERNFEGLSNAYFMDNTDIMDHIWDVSRDYNHPCDHGLRPIVYRILALMRRRCRPSFIP